MTGTRVSRQPAPKALDANVWDYYDLLSEELGGFSIKLETFDGRPGCLMANRAGTAGFTPRLAQTAGAPFLLVGSETEAAFDAAGVTRHHFEAAILDALGVRHMAVGHGFAFMDHEDEHGEKRVPWAKIAKQLNIVRGPHPVGRENWQCSDETCACHLLPRYA